MGVNEKIRALIEQNQSILLNPEFRGKNDPPRLVYDGIVDSDSFCNVLFFLKESTESGAQRDFLNNPSNYIADEFPNGNWDFIKTTNRVAKNQKTTPQNWDTICFWTEAFFHSEKPYQDALSCGENLNKVAIVNLKKTTGESQSDDKLLKKIVSDSAYGQILRDEISMISPKLVVCGGTFKFAKILYRVEDSNIQTLECGTQYFVCPGTKTIFVEFIHPSQRGAAADKRITYAYAKEVFSFLKNIDAWKFNRP